MYILIQQGAEEVGASVARFCREASIARAVLWEARRGFNWTDPEVWDQIVEQIARIEGQELKPRARLAANAASRCPNRVPRRVRTARVIRDGASRATCGCA